MHLIYQAIDSAAELLRRNVKRNSWLWNGLRRSKNAFVSLVHNPTNKRRWKLNAAKFNDFIEQYSRETSDFFVLQIGANDGVMADPIYKLVKKYGWQGILVEPQKMEFERLKYNYRDSENLRFENVAIAEDSGHRPLYKVKEENITGDWQRGIASFLPKQGLDNSDLATTEMVQCVTFDALFNRHQVKKIDLLQIDVEGYDYKLIKLFDFGRIKPRLIRYEHELLSFSDRRSSQKHLIKHGYEILEMEYDTAAVLRHVSCS